ncbi:MAG: hypothetical protein HZB91_02085 [Elusimicrobia bacterium]|nr:hypothetical protein [Elusimicrobiota bacterium]
MSRLWSLKFPAVAGLLLSCFSLGHGQPSSGIRVEISSAAVTGVDCRMRDFKMEYTKGMGRSYRHMAGMTFTSDPDPRHLATGIGAMIAMVPLTVLAVPADVLSAPLRRECDFRFRAQGQLKGWAGTPARSAELAIEGRALVSPGEEDVSEPVYDIIRSSAVADTEGRFDISVPGRIRLGRDFEVHWFVAGRPSGSMTLRKRFNTFVLSEPESEFGTGIETIEPIVIHPK